MTSVGSFFPIYTGFFFTLYTISISHEFRMLNNKIFYIQNHNNLIKEELKQLNEELKQLNEKFI